jgi:hypothetical protein
VAAASSGIATGRPSGIATSCTWTSVSKRMLSRLVTTGRRREAATVRRSSAISTAGRPAACRTAHLGARRMAQLRETLADLREITDPYR